MTYKSRNYENRCHAISERSLIHKLFSLHRGFQANEMHKQRNKSNRMKPIKGLMTRK